MRVTTNASSRIALVIFRTGSEDVSPQLFVNRADTMGRLATFVEPIFISSDIIWLNKSAYSDMSGSMTSCLQLAVAVLQVAVV